MAQIMSSLLELRLKWKKVGKTSRPFRYDLNQIPYGYTVEVINRFKGLDLVDRVPKELWTEVCNIVQEAVNNNKNNNKKSQRKTNARRQSGCLRRPYKYMRKEEEAKIKIYAIECRVLENSKEG